MSSLFSRNIRLYFIIIAFQSAWFVEAVWFFYWNRFASYTIIGILFSITTILAILCELPTGVFADKFGRKNATIIGTFLLALGGWFIAFGLTIWWLFFGVIMQTLGRTFISGALEALTYDSLEADGKTSQYEHIAARKNQIGIIFFAVAVITGGFLYQYYFRLPHIMMGIALTISWIASLFLIEPPKAKTDQSAISITRDGLKQLLQPKLHPYMVSAISILIVYFLYEWGFAKPAIAVHFGMGSSVQGIAFALMTLTYVGIVGMIPRIRKKISDLGGLRIMNVLAGIGFLAAIFPLGWWGIIPMIGIEIATNLSEPWLSVIINQHIRSEYRATTLSALQLIGRFPYLLINLSLGALIDHGQSTHAFLAVGIGIFIIQGINLFTGRNVQKAR